MRVEEQKQLAGLTTFGIGGPARWFVEAGNEAEVEEAVEWARERVLELLVLGGGSNLLVADGGFDGLVLKIGLRGVTQEERGDERIYRAEAGEDWDGLVPGTRVGVTLGWAGATAATVFGSAAEALDAAMDAVIVNRSQRR